MLDLAMAHERADWEAISALAPKLGIKEDQIPEIYVSAVDWASALRRGAPVSVAS
jgi:c-di-GMP-related signal transduction protein